MMCGGGPQGLNVVIACLRIRAPHRGTRHARRSSRMVNRRVVALVGAAAVFFAACGGGATASPAASTAPSAAAPSAAASTGASAPASAAAGGCVVGVSWNNFQQPRWAAHDEPGIKNTVEAGGGSYIRADANLSSEQQLTDITTMISKGAKVLIILAQDNKAILPALKAASDAGIPVIAYDRLIEAPSVLYMTFDNVGVGKAEASAILTKVPKGNYVPVSYTHLRAHETRHEI